MHAHIRHLPDFFADIGLGGEAGLDFMSVVFDRILEDDFFLFF